MVTEYPEPFASLLRDQEASQREVAAEWCRHTEAFAKALKAAREQRKKQMREVERKRLLDCPELKASVEGEVYAAIIMERRRAELALPPQPPAVSALPSIYVPAVKPTPPK